MSSVRGIRDSTRILRISAAEGSSLADSALMSAVVTAARPPRSLLAPLSSRENCDNAVMLLEDLDSKIVEHARGGTEKDRDMVSSYCRARTDMAGDLGTVCQKRWTGGIKDKADEICRAVMGVAGPEGAG